MSSLSLKSFLAKHLNLVLGISIGVIACVIAFTSYTFLFADRSTSEHSISSKQPSSVTARNLNPYIGEKPTFCGERVPVEDQIVKEQLEMELVYNMNAHAATTMIFKCSNRWKDTILNILTKQGIPQDFYYLMVAESAVRNQTSYRGAQGFWQFMPATAVEFGLVVNKYIDQRNDPILSTYAACKYLKQAYNKFNNWTMVAGSYNMGMQGIHNEALSQSNWDYHQLWLNSETMRYVYRIVALKMILEQPHQYGFHFLPSDLYPPFMVKRSVPISGQVNLAGLAKQLGTSVKTIRTYNPWIRDLTLALGPNESYVIRLPS
jgi:membrane-bound lytic murein transglycosylase D